MSRQNKVNPGMYTQRGRLTQDDAARELRKQRAVGSEHTWQPSKKDHFPRLASKDTDAALGAETSGDKETEESKATAVRTKPASRVTRPAAAKKAAPVKAKAKQSSAKSKTAKKTVSKAKSAKSAKPAAKRAATKTVRKAVLARNVGGGGPKPRKAAKRRKS